MTISANKVYGKNRIKNWTILSHCLLQVILVFFKSFKWTNKKKPKMIKKNPNFMYMQY